MKMLKRYHWLANEINRNHMKSGAELGAATGNTTKYLLISCPGLRKLVVADIWKPVDSPQWSMDNMEEIFHKKIGNDPRVSVLKGLSWEMAVHVKDESLDFVFIDATHTKECVKKDILAWDRKVKKNGLICGHDINLHGVLQAVNELLPGWKDSGVDHVWYYYKT